MKMNKSTMGAALLLGVLVTPSLASRYSYTDRLEARLRRMLGDAPFNQPTSGLNRSRRRLPNNTPWTHKYNVHDQLRIKQSAASYEKKKRNGQKKFVPDTIVTVIKRSENRLRVKIKANGPIGYTMNVGELEEQYFEKVNSHALNNKRSKRSSARPPRRRNSPAKRPTPSPAVSGSVSSDGGKVSSSSDSEDEPAEAEPVRRRSTVRRSYDPRSRSPRGSEGSLLDLRSEPASRQRRKRSVSSSRSRRGSAVSALNLDLDTCTASVRRNSTDQRRISYSPPTSPNPTSPRTSKIPSYKWRGLVQARSDLASGVFENGAIKRGTKGRVLGFEKNSKGFIVTTVLWDKDKCEIGKYLELDHELGTCTAEGKMPDALSDEKFKNAFQEEQRRNRTLQKERPTR